jgi:hypothetical protein
MDFNLSGKLIKALPVIAAITVVIPSPSFAGFFGDHPSYLHAISHLRHVRQLLERPDAPNVEGPELAAIREVDASLAEIKQAARDDWKPLADLPQIHLDLKGRLHEAFKELERAQKEINKEEDDRAARGLRNRALGHLNNAMNYVQQAIGNKEMDRHI